MRYAPISSDFFVSNRRRFVAKLKPDSVAIFNSNDEYHRNGDQNFSFRQNSDLFYLTGIEQEQSILILAPDHPVPKLREVLFLLEPNEQMETWFGHKLTIAEAQKISGIKNVMMMPQLELAQNEIILASENIYFNFNEYVKYANDLPSRDQRFAEKIKSKYLSHNFERSAPILENLRSIKSDVEIGLIQNAVDITEKAFRRVLKNIKPGQKEYEVQAEIEYEFTRNGAKGHAYSPIIATGINACTLHYIENDKACKNGDLLLMDFGAEYANYAADLTRTIPVNGKFSLRQREIYEAVLRVQKKAIKLLVVGNTVDKLNKAVNEFMKAELLNLGLLTKNELKDPIKVNSILFKYYMHGTSHYLGLDVHDVGSKYAKMKAGMVFTCEPALYIKDEGIGIRLENDILITENGPVDLMKNVPIDPDEIEALMAEHN